MLKEAENAMFLYFWHLDGDNAISMEE